MVYKIYEKLFTLKVCHCIFQPMWSSSGVKIIGQGNCCLLLLLMFLIYESAQCACVFELVVVFLPIICCSACLISENIRKQDTEDLDYGFLFGEYQRFRG
jgi:hypothetical protein